MTPNAELWCRRMDYAEGLPLWYVNALGQSSPSASSKIRYHRQANEHYQKWCRVDTAQRTVI